MNALDLASVVQSSEVVLPTGLRLRYVSSGSPEGQAVLMLHGITDSSLSFRRVMPLLPSDLRVVALDQRGHGASDRPLVGYTMDDFASDALQVMDALALDHPVVVGHSMGSFVARRMAERAPDRLGRLVLVGTGLMPRNSVLSELLTVFDSLSDPVSEAFVREFQMSCIHQPVPADFMNAVIAESRKVPARVWRAAMAGLWSYRPQWPLTVPTTIIGGDRDIVFSRAEHQALFEATERSALFIEPEIGHTIHWEAPHRFVELAFRDA